MKKPLYQHIAGAIIARNNCIRSGNLEWRETHEDRIGCLVRNFMPSGSGIDCGTKFVEAQSTSEKLVFSFSFHHMNESGMYDGWTEHLAVVRPSLWHGLDIKITGRDRNGIKEYLHEVFSAALEDMIEETENGFRSVARDAAVSSFKAKVASGEIK